MRTLSPDTQTRCGTSLGTQPLVVIRVVWPTGAQYYADRDFDLAGTPCAGKILELGAIASIRKSVSAGEASSVSITLDDSDGTIKSIIDQHSIEAVDVEVYHIFADLTLADLTLLLKGSIKDGYTWSEGQRQISFTVDVVPKGDTKVGYAPTGEEMVNISREAAGQAWPLSFGTVITQKTLRPYAFNWGKLLSVVNEESTDCQISNGSEYEQGTEQIVRFSTAGVLVAHEGIFAGNTFTFTEKNVAVASNIAIGTRDSGDSDYDNPSVLWLADDTSINGMYCCVSHEGTVLVNYCKAQYGRKCIFSKPWKQNGQTYLHRLPDLGITEIFEVSSVPRAAWGVPYTYERFEYGQYTIVSNQPTSITLYPGTDVGRNITIGQNNLRIANLVPSTEILAVYAYRTFQNQRQLWPVPTRYYTKNLSDTVNGKNCTTITVGDIIALKQFGWEDEIYVSLRSSIGNNTADILKYIIETYTAYAVDNTSYLALKSALTRYPSNFTLTSIQQAIPLCEEIAYQARSAILVSEGKVYFKYLAAEPASTSTMTVDSVEVNSMALGATQEAVTRYIATWKRNGLDAPSEHIVQNNVDLYGVQELKKEFYIYNIESLVKLSAHFWAWRLSNSWRTMQCSGFLTDLATEAFDTSLLTINILSPNSIKALVTNMSLDTKDSTVQLQYELASLANDHDVSNHPIQTSSYWSGDPAFPVTGTEAVPVDVGAGYHEQDYDPPIESSNAPDAQPQSVIKIAFRNLPQYVVHDQDFTFTVQSEYEDGSVLQYNGVVDLTYQFAGLGYTPSVMQVTLVNGVAEVTAQIQGSGQDGAFTISGLSQGTNYYGLSTNVPLYGIIPVEFGDTPAFVERNNQYVSEFQGEPNADYGVVFYSEDANDKMYVGGSLVSTVHTDADGNGVLTFTITGGETAIDNTHYVLSYSGRTYKSPTITVLDIDSSINVVVTTSSTGLAAGDVVMNSGSSWVKADTTLGKTLGVVGRILSGTAYIVVQGLICIPGLTPHTDYFVLSGGLLSTDNTGRFVLRAYTSSLCWVGGGSTISHLTDIADVTKTTIPDQGFLYWDAPSQKWLGAAFTTIDQSIRIHNNFDIEVRDKGITFAKMQDFTGCSVLGKGTTTTGTPTLLTAGANGQVLQREGDELYFDQLSDMHIKSNAAIAWSKINKTGAGLGDIPNSTAYIQSVVNGMGLGSGNISLSMNSAQGIAHSDNTTGVKTGTSFTLGFFPFTAKGQIMYCNGSNPVNSQYTITNLNGPGASPQVLIFDKTNLIPKWALLVNENIDASAAIAWSKINKTGGGLGDIPNATSYIQTVVNGMGLGSGNISISMNSAQGIAHSDNTTSAKTGTSFTLGFFPFTAKGQIMFCDGTNPVNNQYTITNLAFPSSGSRNALLVADSATAVPAWKTAVEIGESSTGGATFKVNYASGKYMGLDANGLLQLYGGSTVGVKLDGNAGQITNRRGSTDYSVCDVATITSNTNPPTGSGVKGQLYVIF